MKDSKFNKKLVTFSEKILVLFLEKKICFPLTQANQPPF